MSDGITDMSIEKDYLKSYLTESMTKLNVKFELQYSDSRENEWTVPTKLTKERVEQITSDFSVKNIRLIIEV